MIFVVGFSWFSRGPDDQGLSCSPGVIIVRERPGRGGLQRLEVRRKGRRALPARYARSAAGAEAIGTGGKVEQRAPTSFMRSCACASPPRSKSGVKASVPGRQCEIANVGKSECERTFARATGTDEVAPIPAVRATESRGSNVLGLSRCEFRHRRSAGTAYVAP